MTDEESVKKQEISEKLSELGVDSVDPEMFIQEGNELVTSVVRALMTRFDEGADLFDVCLDIVERDGLEYAFVSEVYAEGEEDIFPEHLRTYRKSENSDGRYSDFPKWTWESLERHHCPRILVTDEGLSIVGPILVMASTTWDVAKRIPYDDIEKLFIGKNNYIQINTESVEYVFRVNSAACVNTFPVYGAEISKYVANRAGLEGEFEIRDAVVEAKNRLEPEIGSEYDDDWRSRYQVGWGIGDWMDLASEIEESKKAHEEAKDREPPVDKGDLVELGVLEIEPHHSGGKRARGEVESFTVFVRDVPTSLEVGDIIHAKIMSFNRGKTSATALFQEKIQ
ncbi:hypothetical protein PNP85_10970 [Halobacterium salinarum]|uniref:hypothetical protein n=1 Tax=Halobacterium salinarum TaxID=2242 RepID=UPI00255663CA|nr:hypothetical protein [Halobacterium salinarum]MDL0140025.1 hypothetical protein [Halobacterium salinarum]